MIQQKLQTFANYAKNYTKRNGQKGCLVQYIYQLERGGKIKTKTIDGVKFVVINEK